MVNLLKFKPNGGQAEYAKYAAGIQPILDKIVTMGKLLDGTAKLMRR